MDINRRNLLKGAVAGAAGTALTGGLLAAGARHDADSAAQADLISPDLVPFHGVHQAGLTTPIPQQRFSTHVALDATAANRAELVALFRTLTDRARFLTSGGTPPDLGVGSPPSDSAVLGPVVLSDGLSVTLSVGSSLFDGRYGLADRKPAGLVPMRGFPNDSLEPAVLHGDLFLQICANNPDTVHHALRDIAKHTRGGMQIRYRLDGFGSPPRPAGVSRNLMGFKDGISQPLSTEHDQLVWIQPGSGDPEWAVGGTYHVVRFIRMLVEFWDRVDINEQETMFGRRRDSGAPLDGAAEADIPDYAADPQGNVIPLTAHVRLANPRTPQTTNSRILRRPYNYDNGIDKNGNLEAGLIFVCFQQDIARQFEATQTRLIDEPLVDYIQPYGGGYFLALPGIRDTTDWYGRALLT
ncbi:MAG TPA: iron uptake transporter deferrochelatase/peroxidase subunit [Pseudonocardia sp.]|uniref:iron uptake transporter deferrochelatase/peroxidase subunit n=1 Tax=Pseudonocardia sp. TaxID=60912 RepID=UPI002B6B4CFB|nr:iron uptake transporter deferrochelatase/peroxidase subunit [Pseudonocardia sp.]HTF47158.1 iron uptake transporter deferrochelatase/peroxidase subunit [Pseudonocardia sp.]